MPAGNYIPNIVGPPIPSGHYNGTIYTGHGLPGTECPTWALIYLDSDTNTTYVRVDQTWVEFPITLP